MERQREFDFTDKDFNCIRGLVRQHAGINLSDAKRDMVYSRLARRLRQLGFATFKQYTDLLQEEPQGEIVQFTNAITTNLTSFFREAHHFEFLAGTILARIIQEKQRARRIRIWSAGCSTGEEPYSIAITVRETLPANSGWDVKILATDLDSDVLAVAREGVYGAERVKDLSSARLQCWFAKGTGTQEGKVKAAPELQRLITFKQLNLMGEWPMHGSFDVIFCRNVVIYFDKPTQRVLFERFADLLVDQGHLIVGHSESLFKVTSRFELLGNTIYRKSRES